MKYHYRKGTIERDVAFTVMLWLTAVSMFMGLCAYVRAYELEVQAERCNLGVQYDRR